MAGSLTGMHIGAHVSAAGGLDAAVERGVTIGADAIQIFTQSARAWRPTTRDRDAIAAYFAARARHREIRATFCHATYLINLATENAELLARSVSCLTANLESATTIEADGVVLHLGSHRGAGLDARIASIAEALRDALDAVEDRLGRRSSRLLLENAAGAGGTVGRSFAELARVLDAAGGDERLGCCIDTQHLFASGVDFSSLEAARDVVEDFDATIGLGRLGCLHLNDSKVPFGANRDRHANLGEGEIGTAALAGLIGHPKLRGSTALVEVPGSGEGPRAEDVAVARALLASGRRRWARAERSRGAQVATASPSPSG